MAPLIPLLLNTEYNRTSSGYIKSEQAPEMLKTELPPDSTIVLGIVLFQSVVYVLSSLRQRTLIKKQRREKPTTVQRPPSSFAFSALLTQLIIAFFLSISYIDGWNFESVGLKFELSPILSLIVGVICYLELGYSLKLHHQVLACP